MESPYRNDNDAVAEALRAQLRRSEGEASNLRRQMERRFPAWRRGVRNVIAGSAFTIYFFIAALVDSAPPRVPFSPWHPWLAVGVASFAFTVFSAIVLTVEWKADVAEKRETEAR